MAAVVEEAIRNSVQSLVKRDSDLARKAFEVEDRINKMELTIAALRQDFNTCHRW